MIGSDPLAIQRHITVNAKVKLNVRGQSGGQSEQLQQIQQQSRTMQYSKTPSHYISLHRIALQGIALQ